MKKLLATILISFSISFVAAQDKTEPIDSSQYAWLYIYRSDKFDLGIVKYDIKLNDSTLCTVRNHNRFIIPVKQFGPGMLSAEMEFKIKLKVDLKPGEKYYIWCSLNPGLVVSNPRLTLAKPEKGPKEFEKAKGVINEKLNQ